MTTAITFCTHTGVAWASGTLISPGDRVGLLQDPGFWSWCFLLQPILFGYYLWSANVIVQVMENLQKSKVVEISEGDIDDSFKLYHRP